MRLAWKKTGSCGKFRRPRTQQLLGGPRRPRRPRYHRYHSIASKTRRRFRHFLGSPDRASDFATRSVRSAFGGLLWSSWSMVLGETWNGQDKRWVFTVCGWLTLDLHALFQLHKCRSKSLWFHLGWLSCPSPHLGMHLDMSHVLFNPNHFRGIVGWSSCQSNQFINSHAFST